MLSTTAPAARSTDRTRPSSRPQTPAPTRWAPVADRVVAEPAASGRPAAMHVVGYLRVSSQEQARSGLGIAAQRQRIEEEAARRGWTVTWCVDDGYSAASLARPGVSAAFDLLKSGVAQGLVVAKLDRLSRSLIDFSSVMEDARRQRWAVVALDLGVDTTTPAGELVANVMAAVAQWERRAIQQRTKDALAAAKARGQRLGRPRTTPPDVVARVVALSADLSPLQVARALTAECVPTTRSAPAWRASTVRRLLNGVALDAEAAAAREAVAAR